MRCFTSRLLLMMVHCLWLDLPQCLRLLLMQSWKHFQELLYMALAGEREMESLQQQNKSFWNWVHSESWLPHLTEQDGLNWFCLFVAFFFLNLCKLFLSGNKVNRKNAETAAQTGILLVSSAYHLWMRCTLLSFLIWMRAKRCSCVSDQTGRFIQLFLKCASPLVNLKNICLFCSYSHSSQWLPEVIYSALVKAVVRIFQKYFALCH